MEETVDIGSLSVRVTGSAEGPRSLVVGQDEDDIRRSSRLGGTRAKQEHADQGAVKNWGLYQAPPSEVLCPQHCQAARRGLSPFFPCPHQTKVSQTRSRGANGYVIRPTDFLGQSLRCDVHSYQRYSWPSRSLGYSASNRQGRTHRRLVNGKRSRQSPFSW